MLEPPDRVTLEAILADLLRLPDDDPHKARAIAKVQAQLDALADGTPA